jgi:hypothetical protein
MDRRNFFSLVGTALAAVLCPWTRKVEPNGWKVPRSVEDSLTPVQLPNGWKVPRSRITRAEELIATFGEYDLTGTATFPAPKGTLMPYCGTTPPEGWAWHEASAHSHSIADPGHSYATSRYIRKV